MDSFCTFWIFPATVPGIGKRAIITPNPTNALQPRMLYKNQMHITTCSGKYKTKGKYTSNKDERRERRRRQTKKQDIPSVYKVLQISRDEIVHLSHQVARTDRLVATLLAAVRPWSFLFSLAFDIV